MQHIPKTPEEYQAEMMRLYRNAHPLTEHLDEPDVPEQTNPTEETEKTEERELPISATLPEVVELESVPPTNPDTDYGFLKVITRTGNEAMPMPGVTVTVTSVEGAETRLHYTTTTNESGETDRIPLPAPTQENDETADRRPRYRNYDVSIYHPDYLRMESRGLPIFAGITSLQKFAMIPLPQFPQTAAQAIVYENTEPRFPEATGSTTK
jgi:hypothetical protein